MIEYLKQLIDKEQWRSALSYAEALTAGGCTLEQLAVINSSLAQARFVLGEYGGAITASEMATKIARDVGDWQSYGIACNALGASHLMLKNYELAIVNFREYLRYVDLIQPLPDFHSNVWFNLALAYKAASQIDASIEALDNALHHALLTGERLRVHAMTLTLIDVSLKARRFSRIPRLLAQSGAYLRSQDRVAAEGRKLYHLAYRCEFALLTKRLGRARALAIKGLFSAEGRPSHQSSFHMLLAQVEREAGKTAMAIDHALAARAYAVIGQRPDLESAASDMTDQLLADR